jgi:hypothetical protein
MLQIPRFGLRRTLGVPLVNSCARGQPPLPASLFTSIGRLGSNRQRIKSPVRNKITREDKALNDRLVISSAWSQQFNVGNATARSGQNAREPFNDYCLLTDTKNPSVPQAHRRWRPTTASNMQNGPGRVAGRVFSLIWAVVIAIGSLSTGTWYGNQLRELAKGILENF